MGKLFDLHLIYQVSGLFFCITIIVFNKLEVKRMVTTLLFRIFISQKSSFSSLICLNSFENVELAFYCIYFLKVSIKKHYSIIFFYKSLILYKICFKDLF